MTSTTLRSDLRTEIRDNINEASGVDGAIWSDTLLNRHITREILSLPKKIFILNKYGQLLLVALLITLLVLLFHQVLQKWKTWKETMGLQQVLTGFL